MQSTLFITKNHATDENSWRQYLSDKLSLDQHNISPAAWNFVNFPGKLYIDDVRALQEHLAQAGHAARVFVLTDMQDTSSVVQNSLLKILEEPPAGVFFILTTTSRGTIIDTICSRCQIVHDTGLPPADLDLFPSLEDLQFSTWPSLDASALAYIITENFSKNQTALKKKAPDYSMTAISILAFEAYTQQILADLPGKNDINYQVRLLRAFTAAITLLSANVSPKNVYYATAISICEPEIPAPLPARIDK